MGNSWGSQGPARGSFLSLAGLGTFRVLPPGLEGTIPAQVEAKGASPGGFGIRESRRPLPTTLGLHRGGSIPGFSQQQERQRWEWGERRERPGVRLSLRPSVPSRSPTPPTAPRRLPGPHRGRSRPGGRSGGRTAGTEADTGERRRSRPGAASRCRFPFQVRTPAAAAPRSRGAHAPSAPPRSPVPPGSPRFPVPVPAPPCPPRTRSEP